MADGIGGGVRAPDTVPTGVSQRRSRIGWAVPLLGMPAVLGLSTVLAVTRATPPGIGILAFFWGMVQVIWVGGPTVFSRRQLPRVDREHLLMTGRSWTGRRTLNLAELSRVRRIKWTFNSQYGSSRRVDYVTLTDRAGVSLTMLRRTAVEPGEWGLADQRRNGRAPARGAR